jgi:hypothetical protein
MGMLPMVCRDGIETACVHEPLGDSFFPGEDLHGLEAFDVGLSRTPR